MSDSEAKKTFYKLTPLEKYKRGMENLAPKDGKKDVKTALMWLKGAARSGEPKADLVLGRMYFEGKEIEENPIQATIHLRRAYKAGIVEALYWSGLAYYYGKGARQDYAKALEYFQAALPWGDPAPFRMIAVCYENGQGCAKNIQTATEYYKRAALAGDAKAGIKISEIYETAETPDYEKAFTALNEALVLGDAEVYFKLGQDYLTGRGTAKDLVSAFQCFEKASEKGSREADLYRGIAYFEGWGVKRDEEKAAELLVTAAESGYEQAYFYAGRLYLSGEYVSKDLRLSQYYLEKAVELGIEEAKEYLTQVGQEVATLHKQEKVKWQKELQQRFADLEDEKADVNEQAIFSAAGKKIVASQEKNQNDIQSFKRKYAQLISEAKYGDLEAEYQLAFYYAQGMTIHNEEIVPQDIEKAISLYEKLAEKGYKDSELQLKISQEFHTRTYSQKILEEIQSSNAKMQQKMEEEERQRHETDRKNRISARAALNEFESLRQFAETGNDEAEYLMGIAYLEGQYSGDIEIVGIDYDYAMDWLTKAAAHGHEHAGEKLDLCVQKKAEIVAARVAKEQEEKNKQTEKLQEEVKREMEKKEQDIKIAALAKKKEFEALEQYAGTGNAEALFFLGQSYYEGVYSGSTEVVAPDINKAIECFTKSLTAGKQEAFDMLTQCQAVKAKAENEKKEQITSLAMKHEFEALLQFAGTGNPDAVYYLGMSYFNGVGTEKSVVVPVDIPRALNYFLEAEEGGNKEAAGMAEQCRALLAEEEAKKEAELMAKAAQDEFDSLVQLAEIGNGEAQFMLAKYYLDGLMSGEIMIVEPNPERALYWLHEAAENGSTEAMEMLMS